MPKLRFLGSETHFVPLLQRTAEPDELVDVAQDVYASREWPESLWAVESAPRNDKVKE